MAGKLEQNKEVAYLSYQLATIKTDVELELTCEQLEVRQPAAEELLGLSEDAPKTRKKTLPKAPPKYQFDENGETKYWSGRGRTPKPIDEALKAGRSLDEFLIKKDASSSVGDEQ